MSINPLVDKKLDSMDITASQRRVLERLFDLEIVMGNDSKIMNTKISRYREIISEGFKNEYIQG